MFKSNHINVSERIIKELFNFADTDKSGKISLQEFKAILSNEKALDRNSNLSHILGFRELMV